jgi:hypothetical protein
MPQPKHIDQTVALEMYNSLLVVGMGLSAIRMSTKDDANIDVIDMVMRNIGTVLKKANPDFLSDLETLKDLYSIRRVK